MSGIYLHIPFCKQACSYCDFYFVTKMEYRQPFVDKLVEEIRSYRDTLFTEEPVKTIYFGGGTPSLLKPVEVKRIMDALRQTFSLETEEVTLEMNPDDVTENYLRELRDIGINRSSMGVQTFKPELLKFMNRAHNNEQAMKCLELLHKAGFNTFTVDLIYGNPGQSPEDLERDLDILLGFNPPHISAYSLTVEPKTRLGKQVELGRIIPPEDDMVASHFDLVVQKLEEAGIQQYEVSNFSKPGLEAVHNSNYWSHENYLGFGPAAHSFWWNEEARRWKSRSNLEAYLHKNPDFNRGEKEQLSPQQLAEERIMMGLRTSQGIEFGEMKNRYNYEFNERQQEYLFRKKEEQKIECSEKTLSLTWEGLKIADSIILDIISLH